MSIVEDLIAFIQKPGNVLQRDELAVRLFHDQCDAIQEYAHYTKDCKVQCIADIPAVPETLYKGRGLYRSEKTIKTFYSSGTSGGPRTAIELSEPGLALMNSAIIEGARRNLFADGQQTRFLLLTPSTKESTDVIMVYGMDLIARYFGSEPPRFYILNGKIDFEGLTYAFERAVSDKVPVTLAGGSFAFAHFIEYCQERGWCTNLPFGSRSLDAGGFKGLSRVICPNKLQNSVVKILGIPKDKQINLLGMTELASQFYNSGKVMNDRDDLDDCHVKINDPWNYTTVIDPDTESKCKSIGILMHVDLAIYDRPCAVFTADLGVLVNGGFCFVKRTSGYQNRGCSLIQE